MQILYDKFLSIFMIILFLFFSSFALTLLLGVFWMLGQLYIWHFDFSLITRTIASLIFVSIVYYIKNDKSILSYIKELWKL